MVPALTELIAHAPWREAVTYRETWPHEYVLSKRDGQQELLAAICDRFRSGEGVACRFFRMNNTYLFVGDHKYWLMTTGTMSTRRATTSSTGRVSTGTAVISWSSPGIRAGRRTTQ